MVNFEFAPVVRPILSLDMLNSKRMQLVFGVEKNSSYMIRDSGPRVLDATVLGEQELRTCTLVAPVVPVEVPTAGRVLDEP